MEPSVPSTSPFSYQIPPSSRGRRQEETLRSKGSSESRLKSRGRGPRSHSSSASSLFSQQNTTAEDVNASASLLRPLSPTTSATKPSPTARSVKLTTRPPSRSQGRSLAQQAKAHHPTVEDDVESVTSTASLVRTPSRKPVEIIRPIPWPFTPTPPTTEQAPSIGELVASDPKAESGEALHPPMSSSSMKGSPKIAKMEPRRNLDDSMSSKSNTSPAGPTISGAATAIFLPQSPHLHNYNPYNYSSGYMSAPPVPDSQRSSPTLRPHDGMTPMNYGYMSMMTGGPPASMYANPYYGMQYMAPAETIMQTNEAPRSPSSTQDEHQQLLEKVAGDINRLLNHFKETHGQLSTQELLAKQSDLSYTEQLSNIKVELEANKKEYEKVIQNLVGEKGELERELAIANKRGEGLEKVESEFEALRAEMDTLQVSKKDLTEGLDSLKISKEKLQAVEIANEKEIDSLKKALQDEKDLHHRNIANVKEQAKDQMDSMQTEFQTRIDDHKSNYLKVQAELTSLLSKYNHQMKDLEVARSAEADHKSKLILKTKGFEDAMAKHGQEIQSIKKHHERVQKRMTQESEEKVVKICEERSRKEKGRERELHDIGARLDLEKSENQRLRDQLDTQRKSKDASKLQMSVELVESLAIWRTKSHELQKENRKLDRLLQGLGCATELKSKGDEFFREGFHQLAVQIAKVSRECFVELPATTSKERMLLIPDEVPTFMDTTAAADEIRACYIQYLISSILHDRIFQPFLFTLRRRYVGVDAFLQSLSKDICRKSERREAIWRQTTLRAAYTVSKAKEAINVVTAAIADEVVDEIKHFAHRSAWPAIVCGIQRIVRSAAEMWRFARVERELIKSLIHEVGSYNSQNCAWLESQQDAITDDKSALSRDTCHPRQVIMCLLPHIVREAAHEGFLSKAEKLANGPCIYLQGRVLYADSPVVLVRRQELETSLV